MSTAPLTVIDTGGGNMGSVLRALDRLGIAWRKAASAADAADAHAMVLPGVGAFGAVMGALETRGLVDPVKAHIGAGKPFLGVCVGQQVLFEGSEETPDVPGLGIFPGTVKRFAEAPGLKIPQIGWNPLHRASHQGDWPEGEPVYFVNSYVAHPADPGITLYSADYGAPFCAAVQSRNVTAFQFHPEKSGPFGQGLIRRWWEGAR